MDHSTENTTILSTIPDVPTNVSNIQPFIRDSSHAVRLMWLISQPKLHKYCGITFNHARKPRKLPTVLTREEANAIIAHLSGHHRLLVQFMYRSGLRVMEAVRLRVKDVDFGNPDGPGGCVLGLLVDGLSRVGPHPEGEGVLLLQTRYRPTG